MSIIEKGDKLLFKNVKRTIDISFLKDKIFYIDGQTYYHIDGNTVHYTDKHMGTFYKVPEGVRHIHGFSQDLIICFYDDYTLIVANKTISRYDFILNKNRYIVHRNKHIQLRYIEITINNGNCVCTLPIKQGMMLVTNSIFTYPRLNIIYKQDNGCIIFNSNEYCIYFQGCYHRIMVSYLDPDCIKCIIDEYHIQYDDFIICFAQNGNIIILENDEYPYDARRLITNKSSSNI